MIQNIDTNIDKNFQFIKIKSGLYNHILAQNYPVYLKSLSPKYYKTYINIFLLYVGLFLSISINIYLINFFSSNLANIIFFFINSLFVGLFIHSLQQALHVGLHYELHPVKKINDIIAYFLGILTGVNVKQARIIHMIHHKRHAEQDDPENSYLFPLTFIKILKFFTTISIIEYCLKIDKNINKDEKLDSSFTKKILAFVTLSRVFSIIVHILIVYIIFLNSNLFFALSWVYGFLTFFPFFASLLNIIEHAEEKKDKLNNTTNSMPVNRLFNRNFFSKYIYASFGAYKHAIHHWDPTVHHTMVDDVEDYLLNTQIRKSVENRKTTILQTLKKII
jgi:fatty acid desaturase